MWQRTQRQTQDNSIYRASIASCSKNYTSYQFQWQLACETPKPKICRHIYGHLTIQIWNLLTVRSTEQCRENQEKNLDVVKLKQQLWPIFALVKTKNQVSCFSDTIHLWSLTKTQAGRRLGSRAPLSNFRAPAVRRCGGVMHSVTIRLPRASAYIYNCIRRAVPP